MYTCIQNMELFWWLPCGKTEGTQDDFHSNSMTNCSMTVNEITGQGERWGDPSQEFKGAGLPLFSLISSLSLSLFQWYQWRANSSLYTICSISSFVSEKDSVAFVTTTIFINATSNLHTHLAKSREPVNDSFLTVPGFCCHVTTFHPWLGISSKRQLKLHNSVGIHVNKKSCRPKQALPG